MSEITIEELEKLKTYTDSLMNHVHWVQQTFDVVPSKNHIATCINFIDLNERKTEFCRELINTIPECIYSKEKYKEVFEKLEIKRGKANASNELSTICFDKFRGKFKKGDTNKLFAQGQFGELLLFNFLQKFYSAVPLLRKMPITTGTGLERNGADAIHYAISDTNKNLFFLGESKAYTTGTFRSAMEKAIESILKTNNEFSSELGLYIYDDFLEEKLQGIAEKFKDGTLTNVEVHLVLLIAYNEDTIFEKNNEAQIKSDIIKTIESKCSKLEKKIFLSIDKGLYPRFNYIFFPVWELDKLIENFQTGIGK
jgi:hypothetical protein